LSALVAGWIRFHLNLSLFEFESNPGIYKAFVILLLRMGTILLWPNPFLAAVAQLGPLSFSFYFIPRGPAVTFFLPRGPLQPLAHFSLLARSASIQLA
jgi:hypothetical protein